jgi:hypothetical protein
VPSRKTKTTHNGRVTIEEEEGRVETRFSPVMDVTTVSDFTTLWDTNVGEFNEGQLILGAAISPNTSGSHEWTAIEYRVVGYLGPSPTILGAGALGGDHGTARLPLRQGDAFDRICVEARIVVNGSPGPGALAPTLAQLSGVLKLWG